MVSTVSQQGRVVKRHMNQEVTYMSGCIPRLSWKCKWYNNEKSLHGCIKLGIVAMLAVAMPAVAMPAVAMLVYFQKVLLGKV